ncbi:hypothetical protein ABMA28_011199 [Loxostege sticticalis]|uniref:Thyroglobulin type-1 domain-containing protein n=1 Tax=Loxostege sticticalis TaxID=481309 RepID=A0ABD0S6J8_LOXSC
MAKLYKLYYFVVLLLCFVESLCDVLCEPGFCSEFREKTGCGRTAPECRINNATHHGLTLPSPTICNCCEFCLPTFNEGDHCSRGGPGLGTTIGRCGHGLTCVAEAGGNFCRRMNTPCHRAQDDFDRRHLTGNTGALEERPECDGKGKYGVVACVPTQTCFCQSETGERIFGEAPYLGPQTKQNMHCRCSRLHEEIKRNLGPGLRKPVVGPRCTPDGNFFPIQCLDRTCHCVDTATGVVRQGSGTTVNLDKRPLTDLICYDASLDPYPEQHRGEPPFNYTTTCIKGIQDRVDLIEQSRDEGFNVDFYSTVTGCLPDWSQTRIAVRNRTRICVDDRGKQIGNYQAAPNTPEFNNMDCKCAHTTSIMGSTTETPVCCANGNFRRIQCRRGMCRCVDSDGRQEGLERADVTRLSCFTQNWRTC